MTKSRLERRLEELEARMSRSRHPGLTDQQRARILRFAAEYKGRLAAMSPAEREAEERRQAEALQELRDEWLARRTGKENVYARA